MRRELERQANRWGIAYTGETSDDELRLKIDERQRSPVMPEITPYVPPCYGLLWEGVPGQPCMDCGYVRGGCLQVFVTQTLPALRAKLGDSPSLEQLAIAAGLPKGSALKKEALLVALSVEQRLQKGASVESGVAGAWAEEEVKRAVSPPASEGSGIAGAWDPEDPEVLSETAGLQGEEGSALTELAHSIDENPTAEEPEGPPVESKEVPVSGKKKAPQRKKPAASEAPPEKPKALPPKKPKGSESESDEKSKPKTKKKAAAKKKKVVKNPPKAGPAQRAKDPAKSSKKMKRKSAPPAKAQQSGSQDNPISYHRPTTQAKKAEWLRRWEAERLKYPQFARAVPQSILQREWKGEIYRVKVLRGAYQLVGTDMWAPTLGMMTTLITGTKTYRKQAKEAGNEQTRPKGTRQMSNWSAKRFWKTAFEE